MPPVRTYSGAAPSPAERRAEATPIRRSRLGENLNLVRRVVADECDATMSEVQEMVRGDPAARDIVDDDAAERPVVSVDQDGRHAGPLDTGRVRRSVVTAT